MRPVSLTLNASIVVVALRFLRQAYHTVLVLALSGQRAEATWRNIFWKGVKSQPEWSNLRNGSLVPNHGS